MKARLKLAIEHQLDNYATGTQQAAFLRRDDGSETPERELLRLNLEQFVEVILPQYGYGVFEEARNSSYYYDEQGRRQSWN